MPAILRRFTLLTLIAIGGCSPTTQAADTPHGTEQWLMPPCDIPGLTQDQYRICVAHEFCNVFTQNKIRQEDRRPNDPRTDEEYKQCVKKGDYDPGPGFYWVIKP